MPGLSLYKGKVFGAQWNRIVFVKRLDFVKICEGKIVKSNPKIGWILRSVFLFLTGNLT